MADLTIDRVSFFHEADRISLLMQGLGFSRRQILTQDLFYQNIVVLISDGLLIISL